jgi:Fic family protein
MLMTADAETTALMMWRIRGEFLEMPGLRLTSEQAARLWHVDAATCTAVLSRLVAERFLTRTRTGAYVRAGAV